MKQIIKSIERYNVKDVPVISVVFTLVPEAEEKIIEQNRFFVIDAVNDKKLFGAMVHTKAGDEIDLDFDTSTGHLVHIKNITLGIEAYNH